MDTLLISFYSDIEDNTYYSDHARRLISECEDLEIPHDCDATGFIDYVVSEIVLLFSLK